MGNLFSTVETDIKEVHEIERIETIAGEVVEEVGKIAKEIVENAVVDVAVIEIEKKLICGGSKRLQSIKEDQPYSNSTTHYSNLHKENINSCQIKKEELIQYKSSDLTKLQKLHNSKSFLFYA